MITPGQHKDHARRWRVPEVPAGRKPRVPRSASCCSSGYGVRQQLDIAHENLKPWFPRNLFYPDIKGAHWFRPQSPLRVDSRIGGRDAETDLPCWSFFLPWQLTDRGGVNQVVLHLLAECDEYRPLLVEGNWEAPGPTERFGYPTLCERVRDPLAAGLLRYALRLGDTIGRLVPLVRKHRIMVVNAHYPGTQVISFLLLRRWCSFKVILSFHGTDIRAALRSRGLKRAVYRWMLRTADAVVPCSEGLLEEIRMLETRLRKVAVIHNGVDPLITGGEPVRRREEGTELVVTIGRFEERKGHDVLLAAFERVLARRPQARLWMIGAEGPELEATRALAAALGDRVTLFVDVPHAQVIPTLAQADVFAFSSRWRKGEMGEGLPIALLEAGALGLPVVTTACCGAVEVIKHDDSGLLVNLEDETSLADGIETLLADREKARRFGAALRQHVITHFRWDRAWHQYKKLVT